MHTRGLGGFDEGLSQCVVDEGVKRSARSLLAHITGASTLRFKAPDTRRGPPKTCGDHLSAFDTCGRTVPRQLGRRDGGQPKEEKHSARASYSHSMVAGGFDEMS